jgi:uncharacterized repeat protein (TIGR02543 family)
MAEKTPRSFQMKKNNFYVLGLLAIVLALGFVFVGCDNGTNPNGDGTFTVTFNSNGGLSVNAVSGVSSGSTISLPNNPTKDSREFDGWYTDNKLFQNSFMEATPVTGNITVYAKWLITITDSTLKQWESDNSYTETVANIKAETVSLEDETTIHDFGNVGSITDGVLTIEMPELLPDQYLSEFPDDADESPAGLKLGWIKFTPELAPYKYYNDLEGDNDRYGGGLFYGSENGSYDSSSTVYEGWFYGANFADHPDHNLAYHFDEASEFFTTKGYNWHIKNNRNYTVTYTI